MVSAKLVHLVNAEWQRKGLILAHGNLRTDQSGLFGIDLAKCTSIIFTSGRKPNPNAMNMHRDKLCELLAVERHLKDLQSKLEMHGAFVLNGADSPLITMYRLNCIVNHRHDL